jgi:DnaK suppressor protein
MDADKIQEFQEVLISELSKLGEGDELGRDSQKTVELDQQAVGRLSRMDALQQQAMANATHVRRTQMRQRILATLRRMDEGEFGYCMECGDEIPVKRLQLDPTSPMCVSCARG